MLLVATNQIFHPKTLTPTLPSGKVARNARQFTLAFAAAHQLSHSHRMNESPYDPLRRRHYRIPAMFHGRDRAGQIHQVFMPVLPPSRLPQPVGVVRQSEFRVL